MLLKPDSKIIQVPANGLALIGGVAILLLMLQVVADVIGREFFSFPLEGTLEIVSFYYMVAVTFLPLAYVCHNEGHISVELFTKGLSRRKNHRLEAVLLLVSFVFSIWFASETWTRALESFAEGEMWETSDDMISIWPSRFVLPVASLMMGIYLFFRMFHEARLSLSKD
tara:strand:- start:147 stop:653 length:507 start_codon:yes stop_codon:yes gene_type:complete